MHLVCECACACACALACIAFCKRFSFYVCLITFSVPWIPSLRQCVSAVLQRSVYMLFVFDGYLQYANGWFLYMLCSILCVCVCVCVRERERERERLSVATHSFPFLGQGLSQYYPLSFSLFLSLFVALYLTSGVFSFSCLLKHLKVYQAVRLLIASTVPRFPPIYPPAPFEAAA